PSATTTSNPPRVPPNVGNAGFGDVASTTRGVPSQLGAAHTPRLRASATKRPGTGARPLLPPTHSTGTSIRAACVRFSMSGLPRPTESGVESSEIDWLQSASSAHAAPTFPAVQAPAVHTPGDVVTPRPEIG